MSKRIAGCIIVHKGKLLLLKKLSRGWYELPAGKIEDGETPEQCAIRETKEELGVDVDILEAFGEVEYPHKGDVAYAQWFFAALKDGQIPIMTEPDEFEHYRFVDIEELDSIPLSPNVQMLVRVLEAKY